MKLTMQDKLNICREHILEGKMLSHISERYNNFTTSNIKYMVRLYKKHGEEPFVDRERRIIKFAGVNIDDAKNDCLDRDI